MAPGPRTFTVPIPKSPTTLISPGPVSVPVLMETTPAIVVSPLKVCVVFNEAPG